MQDDGGPLIWRDAANLLVQRNGENPMSFVVPSHDHTDYERLDYSKVVHNAGAGAATYEFRAEPGEYRRVERMEFLPREVRVYMAYDDPTNWGGQRLVSHYHGAMTAVLEAHGRYSMEEVAAWAATPEAIAQIETAERQLDSTLEDTAR